MSANNLTSSHEKLKDMMQRLKSKAKYIHEEVRNEELQSTKKRKSEVSLWLEQVSRIEEEAQSIETQVENVGLMFGRRKLMQKLQEMTERAEKLIKQSEFSRGLLLNDFDPHGLRLVTEKLEGSTPSKVQDQIWSCFESGNEARVGVYGMGGVGKTSLSMHINNKILEHKHLFDNVYFVSVSRDTSVLKLQHDIAKAFGVHLVHEDEPKRAAELSMAIAKRERSLLILDDVWEDISMEKVGVSVEGDGCKLLITTRRLDVCRKMECLAVKLEPLSAGESWSLFKKKLGVYYEALSEEAKGIADMVAKECGGLPLAIITMAGSMRGESSEYAWRDALRTLQSPFNGGRDDMDSKVFSILRFSYDRLKDNKHQKRFLYCALYPEDFEIEREELIGQFIALGLAGEGSRREKMDKGHTLINALVNASLLEHVTRFDEDTTSVRMHDLVRDMAIRIIGERGMVKAGISLKEMPRELLQANKDVEWVSLMHNEIEEIGDMSSPNVSTFLLQRNCSLEFIPHCFFVHMISLKVLNLSHTSIKILPNSVSDLVNLSSIVLVGCQELQSIPSLAKLAKLQEIVLQDSCVEEFPDGMEELVSLEHLDIRSTLIHGLHEGIFCNLRNLEVFLSNNLVIVPARELVTLRNLRKFMEGVFADPCSLRQCLDLGCFEQWTEYFVSVGSDYAQDGYDYSGEYDRGLQLRKMGIATESFISVPGNAQFILLNDCSFSGSLLEDLPSLNSAAGLQFCEVSNCEGIEYIIPDEFSKPLDVIQRLRLHRLNDLCGLVKEEVLHSPISLSVLTRLAIYDCHRIKRLWLMNVELPNLETINICRCDQMEVLFATKEGETIKLPKLSSLRLRHMQELKSIWGGGDVWLPRLAELEVIGCHKVRKLGLTNHKMPSLAKVKVYGCKQMEEVFAVEGEA